MIIGDNLTVPIVDLAEDSLRPFIQDNKTALIVFYASWCGPCKMMDQILTEMSATNQPPVAIGRVDIDENRPLVEKYEITGVPTIIVYFHAKPVVFSTPEGNIDRIIGVVSKESLGKIIEQMAKH